MLCSCFVHKRLLYWSVYYEKLRAPEGGYIEMTDPVPDAPDNRGDKAPLRSDNAAPPATPRWVKMFGYVALALLILFIIIHIAGGGMGGHH